MESLSDFLWGVGVPQGQCFSHQFLTSAPLSGNSSSAMLAGSAYFECNEDGEVNASAATDAYVFASAGIKPC
ncbi:hypothetical protein VTP01DRAFT_7288 [Rhizomucor pusillus]|uniref:uncharacterized protein n=1 Tax=Rhizomucor pusillus TaxID=4840 RepID=UPI00374253BB